MPAEKRAKIASLADAYVAAQDDLDRKQQLVREAVELGAGAAKRLQPAVKKERNLALMAYQKAFRKELARIEQKDLDELQPRQLVEASAALAALRERTVQLGEMAERLALPEEEGEPPSESFADWLEGSERDTITAARNAVVLPLLDREEAVAIILTNQRRAKRRLPLLAVDLQLCQAAADHSRDMESRGFFSHISPVPEKKSFTDRARRFKVSASAENICISDGSGEAAFKLWAGSSGHLTNMLNPEYQRIGVGRSGGFFTQMFGR